MVYNWIFVIYYVNEEKIIWKNFFIKFCNVCVYRFYIIILLVDMDKVKIIFIYYVVFFVIKFIFCENLCLFKMI